MATRRLEDERYAYFAEAAVIFLDLPDAVFRGYEGDDQLLGSPREDDDPPYDLLRQEIARLEPQKVYFPLGVGGHVDHQLDRRRRARAAPRAAGLGDARSGLGRDRDLLRGLPVRLVELVPPPRRPRRPGSAPCRPTSRSCPSSPT